MTAPSLKLSAAQPRPRDVEEDVGRGDRAWAVLLAILLLAVFLSPRLRFGELGGKDLDLRFQDFLILPLGALALLVKYRWRLSVRLFWGGWLFPYMAYVIVVSAITLILNPQLGELRQASFLVRHLEVFVGAIVVGWLYLLAGRKARQAVVVAIVFGVGANLLWILFQVIADTRMTLLASAGTEDAQAYGPMLVGESSPFASGAMAAFAGVVAVSAWRVGKCRVAALAVMGLALLAAVVIESRSAVVALLVVLALGLAVPANRKNWTSTIVAVLFGAFMLLFVNWAAVIDTLSGRYSAAGWVLSLDDRETRIWSPLVTHVSESPFFGHGPGALGGVIPYSEAHNVFLRIVIDFGLVGLVLFTILLGNAVVRSWRMQRDDSPWTAFVGNLALGATLCLVLLGIGQDSFTAVGTSHLWSIALGVALGAFSSQRLLATDPGHERGSVG